MTKFDPIKSQKIAQKIRQRTIHMIHSAKASHLGSCFSTIDILAVLYGQIMKIDPANPGRDDRDRFILSKGHAGAAVFATLGEFGFFPKDSLQTYCGEGSAFTGHISHHVPGVEVSSGSLGHGLPIGCGMALAARADQKKHRIFVMLSDGECDEGSNWEAILFAPHHQLDNLVVIVDFNKIQSFGSVKEVLDLDPFADKWRAFNWAVREIDGHDHLQIYDALSEVPFVAGKPSVIIAHTIKGKGIKHMENQLAWHYKSPDAKQLQDALEELEAGQ